MQIGNLGAKDSSRLLDCPEWHKSVPNRSIGKANLASRFHTSRLTSGTQSSSLRLSMHHFQNRWQSFGLASPHGQTGGLFLP